MGNKRLHFNFFPRNSKKKAQATISACLIVKNEAAHLARCLESLTGVVSEIIVVDTGSGVTLESVIEDLKGIGYPVA